MRKANIQRKTKETQIRIGLDLDGQGRYQIRTPMPFLDHMLSVMAKHGLLDLTIQANGDTEVDFHHTVEDLGIVLGEALKKALGQKIGVQRFGAATVPLDDALAWVSLDLSGRPYLVYKVVLPTKRKIKDFDPYLIEHFFEALATHCGMTLHINVPYGKNPHHILEAVFKAFGKALEGATRINVRMKGIPSTKGKL
ncbi:MAG: imidazoleglycerol-phosphate dehydratase HisB [Nitrospira sp.]|nr:imidazoleglycerol-phosphate dehydratase HisB [Nitrospira sp.]